MTDLPEGDRQEIITWTVLDRSRAIKGRGLQEGAARALCTQLADDVSAAPVTLQRVTYVAFTHREDIETFGSEE